MLRQALAGEEELSFDKLAADLQKRTQRRKQTPPEIRLREGSDERDDARYRGRVIVENRTVKLIRIRFGNYSHLAVAQLYGFRYRWNAPFSGHRYPRSPAISAFETTEPFGSVTMSAFVKNVAGAKPLADKAAAQLRSLGCISWQSPPVNHTRGRSIEKSCRSREHSVSRKSGIVRCKMTRGKLPE